ncbi:MAG: CotH kinase family protein [Lachnospiraceae bacterium]|nr:CotH kinase family protein [Lachnospiraceae bacterium]
MSSKKTDRIAVVVTVLAIIITALFMNGKAYGLTSDNSVNMGYEEKIFDDSYVHTIDIQIDDWDAFIETATEENYTNVDVTIDGENYKNVGLRAKGNTSLSTVAQLGSERYSLKIEFDEYQDNFTYYGLDKLCLNNLIQDYTMMKDYLTYKMMGEFGAAAPLCSYAYLTINGEEWGLFLAVEAVEESFLERNYGRTYGELYKPDSMGMGGGRGNGERFNMQDMDFDELGIDNPFENASGSAIGGRFRGRPDFGNASGGAIGGGFPEMPEGFGDASGSAIGGGFPEMPEGFGGASGGAIGGGFGGGRGGFGMGSDDAKLKYVDDDADSYSTIFDSAKTTVKNADKTRLIKSLKNLSKGIESGDADTIASAVNVDEVLRYMVVHNFVVNGDSYTGSMIHNYYLYEKDGLLSMIPWDYNLAFGTFQGNDATSAVNDPIDTPLSITEGNTDRPMFSWITASDEYTEAYHEYFNEFVEKYYETGYLENLIDSVHDMIAPYVEKDPTKFCTTEEFETGVKAIKEFVALRFESIKGQLNGSIGSNDSAQAEDQDALIDASALTLSDMGTMGGGFGRFNNGGGNNTGNEGFGGGMGFNGRPGGMGQGGRNGTGQEGSDRFDQSRPEGPSQGMSEGFPGGAPGVKDQN